ncbi:hypothetical protein Y1Q_0007325 [Alligator mississippiensis]|uniref:Uncharacterized protein n=1 Tax=Alligator mississippiensis TaxID=8496 RepID=A0A151P7L6_ALLMI|nr:hypothetical protein Y1Q_0007325 [Alligator mississippiensis]
MDGSQGGGPGTLLSLTMPSDISSGICFESLSGEMLYKWTGCPGPPLAVVTAKVQSLLLDECSSSSKPVFCATDLGLGLGIVKYYMMTKAAVNPSKPSCGNGVGHQFLTELGDLGGSEWT